MDATEIAQMIGVGGAAFVASLLTQKAQIGRLRQEGDSLQSQVGRLKQEGLDVLQSKLEALQKDKESLERRLKEAEDRLGRAVTDEEFHAYVRTTTDAVHGLSEKVGRAAGAIEAWVRMANSK